MMMLPGKHCIITGGGGSIGRAAIDLFLEHGAMISVVDRDKAALEQLAAEYDGGRLHCVAADVSDPNDTRHYLKAATGRFGPIDVLFSNAGIDGPIVPVTEYPEEMFDAIIAVHVKGTFLAIKYALPQMRDGGSIVITSSVVGVMGVPGNCAYVAAKHALMGLTRGIAKEVAARSIRVNAVNPAPVDNSFMRTAEAQMSEMLGIDAAEMFNNMIPLGRHAEATEVAKAALFLASDQSSYMTGSALMVDGGMSA